MFSHRFNTWNDQEWPNRYGDWREDPKGAFALPEYLSGSDYSGSLVEVSNAKVWSEQFADGCDVWWTEVSGGHGTFAIVVKVDAMPDEAKEFLAALSNYPLADEDDHSHLEIEAQDRAFADWAGEDFLTELAKLHGNDEPDECPATDDVYELFGMAMDRANEYWQNESGDSMYIDVKRMAKVVTRQEYMALLAKAE